MTKLFERMTIRGEKWLDIDVAWEFFKVFKAHGSLGG